MTTNLSKQDPTVALEQVMTQGDLTSLTAEQRVLYYQKVCESLGLNWLTKPFEYLKLSNKLVLYARREASDQLRKINGISLSQPRIEYADDLVIVTIDATDKTGRTDSDMGAVSIAGLRGEAKANAVLKCVTKAKRRVTLSISGLGWLDETEVDTIPGAQHVETELPANPRIVEPTTGEILSEPAYTTPYAAIVVNATGKLREFLDWCYNLHRENGPCSDDQYRYLAGLINAITGVNASHNAVLASLVRRPVSIEDVPGRKLVAKLLETLPEHKTVDEVKIANPTYKRPYASAIKRIYELTREIDGQARLLDDTDEILRPDAQELGVAEPLPF